MGAELIKPDGGAGADGRGILLATWSRRMFLARASLAVGRRRERAKLGSGVIPGYPGKAEANPFVWPVPGKCPVRRECYARESRGTQGQWVVSAEGLASRLCQRKDLRRPFQDVPLLVAS